jgi:hypothetical protein
MSALEALYEEKRLRQESMRLARKAALARPPVVASPWSNVLAPLRQFAAFLDRECAARLRECDTQWATSLPAILAERSASDLLTVVLTTSACPLHPSTWCLETVLASFRRVPGLDACRIVVVCDGFVLKPGMAKPRPRAGMIDEAMAANYATYVERLRRLAAVGTYGDAAAVRNAADGGVTSPLLGATVVVLETNHGFGRALEVGVEHVTTPFVLVVQHDRYFERAIDVDAVLSAMRAAPHAVKYVIAPTSMLDPERYRKRIRGKELNCGLDVYTSSRVVESRTVLLRAAASEGAAAPTPPAERRTTTHLVPLMAWIDSTHFAYTDHYRNFVFEQRTPRDARVRRVGRFIEDKLGQEQFAAIRAALAESNGEQRPWLWTPECDVVHRRYGTFILVVPREGDVPPPSGGKWTAHLKAAPSVVKHIDGRDRQVAKTLARVGLVEEHAFAGAPAEM